MWTKNAGFNLRLVLDRIDQVIPKEAVGRKIMIDDGSLDNTKFVGAMRGWEVVPNRKGGISAAANQALDLVETPVFLSFEQDLILARDWFRRVPSLIGGNIVAASGMRFADRPRGLTALQKYVAKKYRGEKFRSSWLRSREMASFSLGKTLDNTAWNAEAVRSIGGFPDMGVNAGIDTVLAFRFRSKGLQWAVDYSVQSVHLRKGGLREELKHQFFYSNSQASIWRRIKEAGYPPPNSYWGAFSRLAYSPLSGLFVALKTGEPSIFYIHPLIRLSLVLGLFKK